MNHSKSKALPVLQTDLNFEQEGRRALWFKSDGVGGTELSKPAFRWLRKLQRLYLGGHSDRLWLLYIKPNFQKLGSKWRQDIEKLSNAGFVTKSRDTEQIWEAFLAIWKPADKAVFQIQGMILSLLTLPGKIIPISWG